jgi:hypothetical protein
MMQDDVRKGWDMKALVTGLVIVFVACGQAPADGQSASALPRESPVRFSDFANGHAVELLFRQQAGTLSFSLKSSSSGEPLLMARRIELWRPLLQRFFGAHGRRADYLLTVGEYPELSSRIAAAAACSENWDLARGTPKTGDTAMVVKDLLSSSKLYTELEDWLRPMGYRLSIHSVESAMLCPWRSVGTDSSARCGRIVTSEAMVPCGASIVFRMTRDN